MPRRALSPGTRLGRYTIERRLGSNVLAEFYLARHEIIGRDVVIELLALDDHASRDLFLKQAHLLALLDHPGIVRVFDADEHEGVPYLALECIGGGRSVATIVAERARLDPVVAVRLALDVAEALVHMHGHGVAHRDVQPENVILSAAGRAVLVDLGVATPLGDCAAGMPGQAIGTPAFMSPEAWAGGPTETGMDAWGLGVTLHLMVAGSLPWTGKSPEELREQITQRGACISAALPGPLRVVLARCLARDQHERYRDVQALRRDLEGIASYLEIGGAKTEAAVQPGLASVLFVDVAYTEVDVPGRYREFRIVESLGAGTFGEVVRAYDVYASREVALKFLRPHLTSDAAVVRRFQREARILARIAHPNLVRVYNFGSHPTRLFIVMELLRGSNLASELEKGPVVVERAVQIALDVLGGLSALHKEGVVHRDVKPANIMLETGRAVLADLGIAQLNEDETRVTRAGEIVGTPLYLSPEQTRGVEASPASDVYAAGVVLFEMLAGVTPHRTLTLAELLLRIATQEAPSVKTLAAHVPDAVADALASFLHLDPSARPQDAGAAREVLERALASPPRG